MNMNVAAITSRAFGAVAYAHADGSTFVRGVAAPVGFMANAEGRLVVTLRKPFDTSGCHAGVVRALVCFVSVLRACMRSVC